MTLNPCPTQRGIALQHSPYATLTDGLDYAAKADTGFNFFDARGNLKTVLTYREMRERAIETAKGLVGFADRDARIGICATTSAEFAILFFACQYAGLVPAPLPLPVTLGGRGSYERQLQRMADTADLRAIFTPASMEPIMSSALNDHITPILTFEDVFALPKGETLRPHGPDDLCYIQYSSGSSSSPKGIIGSQKSVTANCLGITRDGLKVVESDRGTPQDFTRRPITWLQLINDHKGTLSYSPTFGYELCVRRWRNDRELDLSSWRAAGIGGDMVRPEPLTSFSDLFGPMGFDMGSFTTVLPDHIIEIRDFDNKLLEGEGKIGRICLQGPSVSPGYFRNKTATEASFSEAGWLDTGDLGYWLDDQLVVTGRSKDLILWHGRNIWPQDLEWAAQAAAPHRCGRACAFSSDA